MGVGRAVCGDSAGRRAAVAAAGSTSAATAASTLTRLPQAELCGRCCCLATRRPGRARLRSSRATSCGREGEALSGQSLSSPCLRIGRCVRGSGPSLSDPSTSGCPWLPPFSLTRVWPHSSCAAPIRRRRRRSSATARPSAASPRATCAHISRLTMAFRR